MSNPATSMLDDIFGNSNALRDTVIASNTYFVTFKHQLSQAILYSQATRLHYQVLYDLYVDKVYEKSKVAHKPNMLDSNNLGGVHANIYSPFLNLHNPLDVHQPMASETILPASINYTGASYFQVAELKTSFFRLKSCVC